ncbi:MAG: membrane biogenesis protein [Clostridia bacterium]|nr:membrane biogenesis protein [Clostridia bacterium]
MLDFSSKPIIAMLHLRGSSDEDMLSRMIKETEIYYRNGVDAVLVENYFGSIGNCEQALKYLNENMPDKLYGVNILGDYKKAFELAEKYNADFVQIDSVCGHLDPMRDSVYAKELISLMKNRKYQVLGGLRFKYQPVRSCRTLEEDAALAEMRCDAVVTTGEGTGMDCPTGKLSEFRRVLGEFPLIAGAGVTADNVCEKLQFADGVIIGSWLKEWHRDYGDVCEEYVKAFMEKVEVYRKNMQ